MLHMKGHLKFHSREPLKVHKKLMVHLSVELGVYMRVH